MSHALLSLEMGLLTDACSPTQKTVVAIPCFQAYSPEPVMRLFLPLIAEPAPSLRPETRNPLPAGSGITLGSILNKSFSGNFIAYFARSVAPSDRDCAMADVPKPTNSAKEEM